MGQIKNIKLHIVTDIKNNLKIKKKDERTIKVNSYSCSEDRKTTRDQTWQHCHITVANEENYESCWTWELLRIYDQICEVYFYWTICDIRFLEVLCNGR